MITLVTKIPPHFRNGIKGAARDRPIVLMQEKGQNIGKKGRISQVGSFAATGTFFELNIERNGIVIVRGTITASFRTRPASQILLKIHFFIDSNQRPSGSPANTSAANIE